VRRWRRPALGKVADMQTKPTTEPHTESSAGDEAIRVLVKRLSRPHPSGGVVIERATILAEGSTATAVLGWIADHDGAPEHAAPASAGGGLHGPRPISGGAVAGKPLRYVLPAGALGEA
jgi:hypothetical protein